MEKKWYPLKNSTCGNINDLPVLLFAHLRNGRPAAKPCTPNINSVHQIPFVHRYLIKALALNRGEDGGVID